MPRRTPSIGAIALLVILVAVLVGGGEDEPDRERSPRAGGERRDARSAAGGGGPASQPHDESGSRSPDEADRQRYHGDSAGYGARAAVVDVVDGDTIEVSLGGEIEDVRYIGVDTPESVAPGEPVECFGKAAARFNARLVEGRTVRLDFDAERRDHYGRLLAYVYVGERFVNAELVRRGYARTLTIAPNDSLADRFERLARAAGAAGRGLWAACGT